MPVTAATREMLQSHFGAAMLKPDPDKYLAGDFAALMETMALAAGMKLKSEEKNVPTGQRLIPPAPISDRSRASLTRASVAKKKSRLKMMDCRVKPGNDSADRSRSNTLGMRPPHIGGPPSAARRSCVMAWRLDSNAAATTISATAAIISEQIALISGFTPSLTSE